MARAPGADRNGRVGLAYPALRLRGRGRPVALTLVTSGDTLIDILGPALSAVYDRPDGLSPPQRRLLGDFFQSCQDWGDTYSDIGPRGHLDAGQDLDDHLGALNEDGLIVYVGARDLTLTGGGRDMPWCEAVVNVLHEHDARDAVKTQTPAAAAT
jgi:hypothetical protein